jgi:hypothetical protein
VTTVAGGATAAAAVKHDKSGAGDGADHTRIGSQPEKGGQTPTYALDPHREHALALDDEGPPPTPA